MPGAGARDEEAGGRLGGWGDGDWGGRWVLGLEAGEGEGEVEVGM